MSAKKTTSAPADVQLTLLSRPDSVTLKDVARVAGVSPITVSRAIHKPELVKPDTVEAVQRVVKLTGYIPNQLAGALTGRRTRLVAAIVPQISNSIFVETIQSLSDRLWKDNYQVLLGLSGFYDSREDELITAILSRRPDGIVLTGVKHSAETRRKILSTGTPVVEVWDLSPSPLDMVVGFSHDKAGEAMAQHLIERGYRKIGLVWADDERSTYRRRGFTETMNRNGIASMPVKLGAAPSTLQLGREGLAMLLDQGHTFDAIACGNDALAQGVMTEAQSRGMKVPDDLAVIGFGDFDFAAHTYPSLTTVRIDNKLIGVKAAEALLEKIEGRQPQERVVDVGFTLMARGST